MERTSKRTAASIVASIAFIVAILTQSIRMILNYSYYSRYSYYMSSIKNPVFKQFFLPYILPMIPLALLVIALLIGKKNIILVVSTGLMTILQIKQVIDRNRTIYYKIAERSYSGDVVYKTNFWFMLPDLLSIIAWFATTLMVVILVFQVTTSLKKLNKKIWFIPGILMFVNVVVLTIITIISVFFGLKGAVSIAHMARFNRGILFGLLLAIGLMMLGRWLAYPNGKEKTVATVNPDGTTSYETVYAPEEDGYISMAMHVLLLIFFGGIWQYIWVYRTTKHLNCVKDEEYRNPTTKLLLCMFIPFYYIYWIYVSAKRIDKLAREKGLQSDIATLSLLMQFILPIVSPILMQDKINAASKVKQAEVQPVTQPTPQPVAQPDPQSVEVQETATDANASIPELLKQYKELLDSGIITEEEYEAKKKQLLGL